ncbi:hypothetical protein BKA67DRAFT_339755 [Truncatella angustata]|uniref:Apple domain-containing protein n=1 Tax=Truncatella angustata TaxID=152316 RepID=A0A9P8ZW81_9PEZI|nr:uncharacterized protein BKA67DRAFT_339755 [Truncatella angustata]KAH6651842.1 hypothetical protein BKA67DRAFT_339755 [Truncatella angustata]
MAPSRTGPRGTISRWRVNAWRPAPEWHPPEPGLEVVQPASAEKIPLAQRGRIFSRLFGTQKIWGLRRRTFCWIILCAVLLVVATVLGVVLGLTLKTHGDAHADASSTSSPLPTATSDPSTATASVVPTPTLSGMPSCPNANGTTYTDPSTKVQFKRECGIAHDGSDISHHTAYSMDDCVASCAQSSACMGAVWINASVQGTDNNWCWLHSDMSQQEYIRVNQYAQSATRVV